MEDIKKHIKVDWFAFELSAPVHYSDGGQRVPVTNITIHAPPMEAVIKAFKIEQMISLATMKSSSLFNAMRGGAPISQPLIEDNSKSKETPQDMAETIRLIVRNSDLDMEAAIQSFSELAAMGCVKVNEKTINFIQWGEIGQADQMEIFFQFVGVFVFSSLLGGPEKKERS